MQYNSSMEVIWRKIPGFGGCYEANNYGEIRSIDRVYRSSSGALVNKRGRILKQHEIRGYLYVTLYFNGTGKQFLVHRLIAELFCSKGDGCTEVNHKDGDKKNNTAFNLEWCTRSDNLKHMFRVLGVKSRGGRPKVKVLCIETGEVFGSQKEAAKAKGVKSFRNLSSVLSEKSYKKTCGGFHWKRVLDN